MLQTDVIRRFQVILDKIFYLSWCEREMQWTPFRNCLQIRQRTSYRWDYQICCEGIASFRSLSGGWEVSQYSFLTWFFREDHALRMQRIKNSYSTKFLNFSSGASHCYANLKLLSLFISLEIQCSDNQWTTENWHSKTKLWGWLCHHFRYVVRLFVGWPLLMFWLLCMHQVHTTTPYNIVYITIADALRSVLVDLFLHVLLFVKFNFVRILLGLLEFVLFEI